MNVHEDHLFSVFNNNIRQDTKWTELVDRIVEHFRIWNPPKLSLTNVLRYI